MNIFHEKVLYTYTTLKDIDYDNRKITKSSERTNYR